jgi:beta-glucanase (GH16 family)
MAVSIYDGGSLPVTTYVPHPLAGEGESYSDPSYSLASSGVWSVDGADFFIVWMDGLISKISLLVQVQIGMGSMRLYRRAI